MFLCLCTKKKSIGYYAIKLNFSSKELEKQTMDDVRIIAELSSPGYFAKKQLLKESSFMDSGMDIGQSFNNDQDDESFMFPFL